MVAVSVLCVVPMGVACLMWRWRDAADLSGYKRSMRHVLGMGFREDCRRVSSECVCVVQYLTFVCVCVCVCVLVRVVGLRLGGIWGWG